MNGDLPGGTETVLVVDDETALVRITIKHLESLGYKTYSAKDGQQALQVLKDHEDIDLLLTDVVMPGGIDGYQLALATKNAHPLLKVLLASGFTKTPEEHANGDREYLAGLVGNLLSKPYNVATLANAVRRRLDNS